MRWLWPYGQGGSRAAPPPELALPNGGPYLPSSTEREVSTERAVEGGSRSRGYRSGLEPF